jgi:hypothetical protein
MIGTDDTLIAVLQKKAVSTTQRPEMATPRERRTPASQEVVSGAEARLGFSLDPFLRRVYLEVCDGGLGPGYGSLPLMGEESLTSTYASFRCGTWPEKLLPVWDWGGATWSCVDPEGQIVTHDDVVGPTLTSFSIRSWLSAWVDGIDLWKELYEDLDATIVNPFTRKPIATKVRGSAKGRPWPNR